MAAWGSALVLLLLALVTGWSAFEVNGRFQANSLVNRLLDATPETTDIPAIVNGLGPYRRWATPRLEQAVSSEDASRDGRRRRLNARLGLVPADETQVEPLLESLLTEEPTYLATIRDLLDPYQDRIAERLWAVLKATSADASRRYRAGLALATYATDSNQWTDADVQFLVSQLIAANALHQPEMCNLLEPLAQRLQTPIEQAFLDRQSPETHQSSAAKAIAHFFPEQTLDLAGLIEHASPLQYTLLFPLLGDDNAEVATQLRQTVRQQPRTILIPASV